MSAEYLDDRVKRLETPGAELQKVISVPFGTDGTGLRGYALMVGVSSVERHRRDHIPRISTICPKMYQMGGRN